MIRPWIRWIILFSFKAMKRLIIICVSAALLVAALVIPSFASSGSITISLNLPFIEYSFVDDPDDSFESFYCYALYAGRSELFWTSEDPDMLMIPDIYQLDGMHFYMTGVTALGSTVRSNTVTYFEGHSLPDVGTYFDPELGVSVEWYDSDISWTTADVYLVIRRSGFSDHNILVGHNRRWIRTNYHLYMDFDSSGLYTDGANLTVFLTTVYQGLSLNSRYGSVSWVNPFTSFTPIFDNIDGMFNITVPQKLYLSWNALHPLGSVYLEVFWVDSGDPITGSWSFSPSHSLSLITRSQDFFNNLYGSDALHLMLARSVKCRVAFKYGSGANATIYYSDWLVLDGLDGLGSVADLHELTDPLLVKVSGPEILNMSNLVFSGVKHTKVYTYVFSALMLLAPFFCLVFLIRKVH